MEDSDVRDSGSREEETEEEIANPEVPSAETKEAPENADALQELNNKYLRLYAEFDNYRKRVAREKEEQLKYGNESLLY